MPQRLTDENIDFRLKNKNIKRIDIYINKRTPIKFQCLICNYLWKTAPHGIINHGTGCPNCVGKAKLTDNSIDLKLKNKNIKRIGSYVKAGTSVQVKCLIENCNHIWNIYPNNINSSNSGCPKCAGNAKLSASEINEKLKIRNIEMISVYTNTASKNLFKCLLCNNIWETKVNSVIHQETGCPQCADCRLTNKIIDDRLKNRNILRIGNYINARSKIEFQHFDNKCNRIFISTTHEIIDKRQGCPYCSYGKNENLCYEVLVKNYNFTIERHKAISKIFNKKLNTLYVDFYLPDTNLIIEYNGDQHYRPVAFAGMTVKKAQRNFIKQQERDKYLQKLCDDNNITIIWIDGRIHKGYTLEPYIKRDIISFINMKD